MAACGLPRRLSGPDWLVLRGLQWRWLGFCRSEPEQVVDGDAESRGELGEDVGARGFFGTLPEGDVDLSLANGVGELGLGEAQLVAPVHLGAGFAEDGDTSLYLFLGALPR